MELIFSNDPLGMNRLRDDHPYAAVTCPKGLHADVENRREGDSLYTTIRIRNITAKPILTCGESIGISFPLEDRYERTDLCLSRRSHVHLFCGGNASWALALRMGGTPPHLGMILTEGALSSYSVLHNGALANDRGVFILHPSPMSWDADEVHTISWVLFPVQDKVHFRQELRTRGRGLCAESDRYVLFPDEETSLRIFARNSTEVTVNKDTLCVTNDSAVLRHKSNAIGETVYSIASGNIATNIRLLTIPAPMELAEKRTRFIAQNQQYLGHISSLHGAYLAYDNEMDAMMLSPVNDYNGGRERVGMGLLMARYLSMCPQKDAHLQDSLDAYTAYVRRELVNEDTGEVFNDLHRDNSFKRNYNVPWFARFFVERWRLTNDERDLSTALRILKHFYEAENGTAFYPIELPIEDMDRALSEAQRFEERGILRKYFVAHADAIIETGTHYPPHEVAFEQSIVGPAADVCLQVYAITGIEKYLRGAETHLALLELFNGFQPDYHRYEIAIRNWDGFWFGKRKLFGDTFPHYWSAITADCFEKYARLTGNTAYAERAENAYRAVLPLIFPNGRASCAYVFPKYTNGIKADAFDPLANDQDWGLYYYLRHMQKKEELS